MKKNFNKAKDGVKGFFRPRSRQNVLATPERSRGSSQEPAATHDPEILTTPSAVEIASQAMISPIANATPSEDAPALEAPARGPSPQPEHTSSVTAAYTQLLVESFTRASTGSLEMQVAESTQDVNDLGTQFQEADEAMRTTRREMSITTGQALLSPCSFRRITHTS